MTDEIGQAKKASEPMLSKPSGSEIDSNLEHPRKALLSISTKDLGNVTDIKLSHP